MLEATPPLTPGDVAGRKLRYDVQQKLVSFMAPNPHAYPYPDAARDDLFRSLFAPLAA